MKWSYGISVVVILFPGVNACAQNADSVLGEWSTEEGRSIVEISRCGDLFCGKIVWLKYPKVQATIMVFGP